MTCPRSHSWWGMEAEFQLRQMAPEAMLSAWHHSVAKAELGLGPRAPLCRVNAPTTLFCAWAMWGPEAPLLCKGSSAVRTSVC